ncbi:unnamed protein product [Spirodela intermedia]|uniref:Uncharacterized protein n=1 Tax=Spirodela intermedia TaxID=51605 RepID=A0A7I8JP91_SPIIN|nr:unnamed protein product [Spirodela intermedia]CAA6671976.1 unnamed protein product [Spirodela intermedia]
MEAREVAERARSLAVMVRVQGPDPKGLKMRGYAFHLRENGITSLSASGLLLPPSLERGGALVVTTASAVEPFLPAKYRDLGFSIMPELIPGASIDVLLDRKGLEKNPNEAIESPTWYQAQLLAIVDVAVSSSALQSLVRSNSSSTDNGSWEMGWMLARLDNSSSRSELNSFQKEFKAGDHIPKLEALGLTNLHQMPISTRVAFLRLPTVNAKDFPPVNVSHEQRRGDFLLAMGSPFGVLSPSHFLNSVSVGAVANVCPQNSRGSLLVVDIRCLPGMEGGPVLDRDENLIGIVTRPLRQKNSSVEIQVDLERHITVDEGDQKSQKASVDSLDSPLEKAVSSIVLITMGDEAWASGILVNKHGLILTNAHLLEPWRFEDMLSLIQKMKNHYSLGPGYKGYKRIRVRLNHTEPLIWSDAHVVYVSKGPLDIALLQLDLVPQRLHLIVPDFVCPSAGSRVHAIGHGPFGPRSDIRPYVSSGVVTKIVESQLPYSVNQEGEHRSKHESVPVMLQTTAAVYPGMSGGAVISLDGRMAGLITSNVKHAGGTTIPHLNFSLPCAALKPVFEFAEKPDRHFLDILDKPNALLSSIWALVPPPPPSSRPQLPHADLNGKEGKGSRFAKFLAERRGEGAISNDLKPRIKGKISSNSPSSKL